MFKHTGSKFLRLLLAIMLLASQAGFFGYALFSHRKEAKATDLNINPNFWNRADMDFGTKAGGILGATKFTGVSNNNFYSTAITNTTDTTELAVSKTITETLHGSWNYGDWLIFVGASGKIIKSNDTGSTWASKTSNTANALYGVSTSTTVLAFAVGATTTIQKSTDNWETWASSNTGAPAKDYYAVHVYSATAAVAVGADGTIIKTTDSGANWVQKGGGVTAVHLRGVTTADATNFFAVGDGGVIVRSADVGETWGIIASGTTSNLRATKAFNTTNAWAVGDAGTILYSSNNGAVWSAKTSGTTENLYCIFNPEVSRLRVGGTNGTYAFSDNTGTAWTVNQSPGINGIIRTINGKTRAKYIAAGDSGAMRMFKVEGVTPALDNRWANVYFEDTSHDLKMPLTGFIKLKLSGFAANEYVEVRVMGYTNNTSQEALPVTTLLEGITFKIYTDKIMMGDFAIARDAGKTQVTIDSQNYMFDEIYFNAQRHSNSKEAFLLINSKDTLGMQAGSSSTAVDYKNRIEITINSNAGKVQLDRLSLAGPTAATSKKSLSDSFPDTDNLLNLSNVELTQAAASPFTKNPANPILPAGGVATNYLYSAIRNGNTFQGWGGHYGGSNGPYAWYRFSGTYPITGQLTMDGAPFIDTGNIRNREFANPNIFLDDDGLYKMIFNIYACFNDRVYSGDDYGGVALAIGGTSPTDTFDIYPNAQDPLLLMSRRGNLNPMGELPDSVALTKTTGLNANEKYMLYGQSKLDVAGSMVNREMVTYTGSTPYNVTTWPTGNVPLPTFLFSMEQVQIIQRDIDDYILVGGQSGATGDPYVVRSRSPYWWEPGLFYPMTGAGGSWESNKVWFHFMIPNEESGIFDMFYRATNAGAVANTGTATARIDGFEWMSLSAGQAAGSMNTVTIEKPDTGWNELKLNLDQVSAVNGDNLKVELLDATTGNPLAGFTQADSDAITTPGTAVLASWNGNTSLKAITGNIKIKLYFTKTTNAPRLYQYKLTAGTNPSSTNLKTEGRTNPAGTSLTPALSWSFSDSDTGDTQKSYQVLVASSQANINNSIGDIWDSGKINGTGTSATPPASLANESVYWWKVRVWDQVDNVSSYPTAQTFATTKAGPTIIDNSTTVTNTVTNTISTSSYLTRYLASALTATPQEVTALQDQIDDLQNTLTTTKSTTKTINKPFGLPIQWAYLLMLLSLLLNLIWIMRIAITRTAPFIP